jgi:hypothetical protein
MRPWSGRLLHWGRWITLTAGVCLVPPTSIAVAQQRWTDQPLASVTAQRVSEAPTIDGRLWEEAWTRARATSTFTQRDPDEGKPSTELTDLRVLFDDAALYIGVRLFDREPHRVGRRLSSRDAAADADWVQISLDPLHDHLSGVQFSVSAAGAQRDSIISNDTFTDATWDAVWDSAVSIDDEGWTAELRIPFSQLRFNRGEGTWGINVSRFIHRKNETAWLELVPRNQSGLASRMAHLTGLDGIEPQRHLELLPYGATRGEFIAPARAGDPFNDGSRLFAASGIDVKWGVTSNLTVDGTVNPDFGQVEVDPAVVNLTAFETFFAERRPFFTEGAQIFTNFGSGGANNTVNINFSEPRIFHSRRIGRVPQLAPTADFVDQVFGTTILGAGKLTGKTANGWSIGLIEAVTAREETRVSTAGRGARVAIEPRTNYIVGRLQRDLNPRSSVGVLATGVIRDLDTPLMASTLARHAFVVGGDGHLFLDSRRDWVVNGKASISHLSGTPEAMLGLQQAPQRYYQRPDAPHVSIEPDRTSLTGFSGRVNLNRNSGNWQVNASLFGVSPGFDVNDAGFNTMSDRAGAHAALFWRKTATDRWTRTRQVAAIKFWNWNFGREMQNTGWLGFWSATFLNYWSTNGTVVVVPTGQDDRLTRGGPSAEAPGGGNWNLNFNTDSRKAVWFTVNANQDWSEVDEWSRNITVTINVKPLSVLTLSAGPFISRSRGAVQYVREVVDATADATYGKRYVFASIDQTQVSMTTRASLILSPRMSLQVFMQPLLASGDYLDFKELARPRTFEFLRYGTSGSLLSYDADSRRYSADPDGSGPAPSFTFADPDFNFKSLRVNTVFRWEVRPGSNLYAVWTRQQQDYAHPGDFDLGRDASALFRAPGDDVFLVKMAYWLGR